MDVEAVADELYGLTPGEFTAARDARAREARKAGDRDAASAISAFRKPTVVAWLANQLVREHSEQVGPLLDLGAALREATASLSGPELRDLSRQRHQLVSALARQARVLGEQAGHRVTEDTLRGVEETLNAALSDPHGAEALAAGRLTEGLVHTGFGAAQVVSGTAAATRTAGASRTSTPARKAKSPAKEEERTARRAELERQLGEAWTVARRTAEVRDDAEEAARSASRRVKEVSAAVTRLREEVRRTEDELQEAEQERDRTNREHDAADQAARAARQQVTDLQRRLDKL